MDIRSKCDTYMYNASEMNSNHDTFKKKSEIHSKIKTRTYKWIWVGHGTNVLKLKFLLNGTPIITQY